MNMQLVAVVLAGLAFWYLFMVRASGVPMGGAPMAGVPMAAAPLQGAEAIDLGVYDSYNPNAFGTTKECDRRVTNYGVRREFNVDPMPLAYGCTDCPKYGVPDPAIGNTHVCVAGPPSKRTVDSYGSHFELNHICAPATGPTAEPWQLGRWWKRNGCSDPASVGLDIRPICTRCGN